MLSLPIDPFLADVLSALKGFGALVLVAEPGAGKTTRVPPAIIRSNLLEKPNEKLVMLQPRRVAARAAAARIADENKWTLGNEVGYQIRFEKRLTDSTCLRVLTEGILTRQLVADPFLEGIGCVILDEFHERSIDIDLALAMLREIRATIRPDLKIIVMSATLAAEPVSAALGDAPIIRVPGRVFPVTVEHRSPSRLKLVDRVASEIRNVVESSPDSREHILVFLPGAEEIRRTEREIESLHDRFDLDIFQLHGSLDFEDQQRALRETGRRRIILSTNIAETSLTIDGVTTVIDSGLARVPRFDPKRGLDRLELVRISKASAEQRKGRAGRTSPGKCIRLWSNTEQNALDDFEKPEIQRVDLAPVILNLRAWGTNDPKTFGWFEAPGIDRIDQAEHVLAMLGAIDGAHGSITSTGKELARLPVHPRIGRLLIEGVRLGVTREACAMAALLGEKDIVRDDDAWQRRAPRTIGSSDLVWRVGLIDSHESFVDRHVQFSARRVRSELERLVKRISHHLKEMTGGTPVAPERADPLLLLPLVAFPDRVCRRRDHETGTMVGGGGVRLHPTSIVRSGEFFLALDARSDERSKTREAVVRIASLVESAWIESIFPKQIVNQANLEFDASTGKVVSTRRVMFEDLVLREVREGKVDLDEAGKVLARALVSEVDELIGRDEVTALEVSRLKFAVRAVPEIEWPVIDAPSLLEAACVGKRSRDEIRLSDALRSILVYPFDRQLDEIAPETVQVPTGSNIRLDYSNPTTAPVLAVRLQELFGLPDTPRIARGRVRVLLHLLGPNYRPVQVTDDLASFWKNTYPQVRKDLRARYPKHSWPENPLEANPIRGARRRKT